MADTQAGLTSATTPVPVPAPTTPAPCGVEGCAPGRCIPGSGCQNAPPVPPATYQWELVRRDKEAGHYPWTHLYKGPLKEPSDSDHEYEPVSPRPAAPVVPSVHVTNFEGITIQQPPEGPDSEPVMTDNDSAGSPIHRAVEEVHVPLDGEDEDRAMSGRELGDINDSAEPLEDEQGPSDAEDEMTTEQMQQQLEDRFFGPSITPMITETRIGGPMDMDPSGLEELPLPRASDEPHSGSAPSTSADLTFQERLRTGAGRLRSRLKNIKKPKLPHVDRSKFHLPERPKFKLPKIQRPNISLPSLGRKGGKKTTKSTKRPLRNRPSSTDSTAGSSEKKPLFDFAFKTYPRMFSKKSKEGKSEDSSTPIPSMTESDASRPRSRSFGSRLMHRFTESKPSDGELTKKKEKETETETQPIQPLPVQTLSFPQDDGQMVYHISLHGSDSEPEYAEGPYQGPPYPDLPILGELEVIDHSARKAAAEAAARAAAEAAAVAAAEAAAIAAARASQAAAEREEKAQLRYQGSFDQEGDQVSRDQSLTGQDSDREARSSATSSERHRRGVIEEIDSDEFFLREKGISQEDVDMSRLIASEIRVALRPPVNSLSRMDYGYYDDEDELETMAARRNGRGPPARPERNRTTYRPKKKKGRKPVPATPPGDEAEEEWEEEERSGYFNTFPPNRPTRNRRAKKTKGKDLYSLEEQRIADSVAIHQEELGILAQTPTADDLSFQNTEPPLPPKRRRKSVSQLGEGDVPMIDEEEWVGDEHSADHAEEKGLHEDIDYIIPRAAPYDSDVPPVPPVRGRKSRSRGTSIADEDRTSRGAESLPSERDLENELPADDTDLPFGKRIDDYAFVEKRAVRSAPPAKPERPRRPKPPRPPAPGRRKRPQQPASRLQNWKQFFSLPARKSKDKSKTSPPTRPTRNYSTLGPARPPRRGSRSSREQHFYTAYLEIQDDPSRTDSHDSRDLQSGDIISKMKDRPLPAPPRPPRKERDHDLEAEDDRYTQEVLRRHLEEDPDLTYEERKAVLAALREDFFSRSEPPETQETVQPEPVQESPYKSLRKKKKIPQVPVETEPLPVEPPSIEITQSELLTSPSEIPPEEISIAIQTDPLPDDMFVEDSAVTAPPEDVSRTTSSTTGTFPTVLEATSLPTDRIAQLPSTTTVKVEIPETLRTERLQVSDLDVDRLVVSELKASKITVSEIESMSLGVSEIHSKTGSLNLAGVELPSDLIRDLLPVSQSLSQALSQQLSETLAQSLSSTLSQIQDALSQPAELLERQQQLQQQLQNLHDLQRQQQLHQQEQLHQQQEYHEQQHQIQQEQLLRAEQQHSAVLHQLQQQIHQLQLQPMASVSELPPPIPPPPVSTIQTQTSLEGPPPPEPPRSYGPDYVPGAPLPSRPAPPPRSGARPRIPPPQDSEEEIPTLVPALAPASTSPSHSLRRRRHHTAHKVSTRYSSDEEEEDHPPSPRRHRGAAAAAEAEPSLSEVGRQLARACRVSASRALTALHQAAQPALASIGDPKRRELQAALCLVLILVAALIILGCGCAGSRVQHHHHWDFTFPPQL